MDLQHDFSDIIAVSEPVESPALTIHKQARVMFLTETDKKKVTGVDVINSMKEIPKDVVGRTKVQFITDSLTLLEDTNLTLEDEKIWEKKKILNV